MPILSFFHFLFSVTIFTITTAAVTVADSPPPTNSFLPSDAVSLLSFKSKADLDNKLLYTLNERFDYCQWQGVKCSQGRVVRFDLKNFGLRGIFPPNTLTRLDQLRVLSLENNSLSGSVPDLSGLINLKSLIMNRNSFSGSFPPSILLLQSLQVLDLSFNNFTGSIPDQLTGLDRIISLRLESNRFNGTIPAFNQPFLVSFNVCSNNFSGQIPVTPILSRFDSTSFLWNPNLCGEIINIVCISSSPFFKNPNATSPSAPLRSTAVSQGEGVVSPPLQTKHKKTGVIIGISIGGTVLMALILCVFSLIRKQSKRRNLIESASIPSPDIATIESRVAVGQKIEEYRARKNGGLVFCAGETQVFTLEQLMRASAELLGKGAIGITYKAVLDTGMIVTVKRLDLEKMTISSGEEFEHHLEAVGGLRHPNLVAIRAYFQAKGERLVIYDYQSNGSLFNLIHGSGSKRTKPLHWTSCLKIAEDVARGLAYIHQASKLIHGNLKSSNVLLGSDFEACLTDYCLAIFADCCSTNDLDSAYYKSPETRQSCRRTTSKSDVYAFGVLLLELLSGKHPSEHPLLTPTDVPEWVQAVRGSYGDEDDRLRMLSEVASICSLSSPEQRPAMWQVMKMIKEIKDGGNSL